MKVLYEKIIEELQKHNVNAKIIAIGRSAMEFYDIFCQTTQDIDFEFISDDKGWEVLIQVLKKYKIKADYSENISNWNVVPLPEGYRERSQIVYDKNNVKLLILEPVDYIFSRLRRGTVEDEQDALRIMQKFFISEKQLKERFSSIKEIKDIHYFLFVKRFENFLKENFQIFPQNIHNNETNIKRIK